MHNNCCWGVEVCFHLVQIISAGLKQLQHWSSSALLQRNVKIESTAAETRRPSVCWSKRKPPIVWMWKLKHVSCIVFHNMRLKPFLSFFSRSKYNTMHVILWKRDRQRYEMNMCNPFVLSTCLLLLYTVVSLSFFFLFFPFATRYLTSSGQWGFRGWCHELRLGVMPDFSL